MKIARTGRHARRRWPSLALRMARLALRPARPTADLVAESYDALAPGYDAAWTDHMRGLTLDMLDRLAPRPGEEAIDLGCGTGFIAEELARRTGRLAIGVDASAGMLEVAHRMRGKSAEFVQADAAEFLAGRAPASADCVTCGWALGYARPWRVIREATRVLRPGGRLAIIDNSLFSLAGVVWCSVLAFAERPEALVHLVRVRFLPGPRTLRVLMRVAGLRVAEAWRGAKTYRVPDGVSAIRRLTATGAAAGFEFAADPVARDEVFARFAEILEARRKPSGIPITHRYLAAIGVKP